MQPSFELRRSACAASTAPFALAFGLPAQSQVDPNKTVDAWQ